jgi:hypothetical protein
VLVLAAAGLAVGSALGAEPAWRVADTHRAVQIGMSAKDAGAGWGDISAKRSPFAIDLGTVARSALTVECSGPVPATKAAVDLEVTGASESALGGTGRTIASIVMMFKTSTVARMQMPDASAVRGFLPCFSSELQKGFGTAAKIKLTSLVRRHVVTGSPGSIAIRLSGTLTVAGATEPVFVDLVLQQESRGVVETAYFGILDPPSSAARVPPVTVAREAARTLRRVTRLRPTPSGGR